MLTLVGSTRPIDLAEYLGIEIALGKRERDGIFFVRMGDEQFCVAHGLYDDVELCIDAVRVLVDVERVLEAMIGVLRRGVPMA